LETEGTNDLEVDRLVISLAGSTSDYSDAELEDEVNFDDQLSGIADLV
jgi:hypothetical protein